MRRVRVLAALGLTWSLAVFGACGGDDSSSGGDSSDAGTSDTSTTDFDSGTTVDSGSQSDSGTTVTAAAADLSLYLGQVAVLDGSASQPPTATFAWTVKSVPGGSAVTTGSLLNASAAKPTFTPDVVGDYVLTLTVTEGSANNAKDVTGHAFDAPVFYARDNRADASAPYVELRTVAAGGGGDHAVMCAVADDGGVVTENNTLQRTVRGGADWWEAPAGMDSRLVFVMDERQGDGGMVSYLAAAKNTSMCPGAQPMRLDTLPSSGGNIGPMYVPRLSPDGNRVAYLRDLPKGARIATVGFDGSGAHLHVAPAYASPDGGLQADAGIAPSNLYALPPAWAGAKVTWANLAGNRFQIWMANDADDATAAVALACTGSVSQYDVLANGDILVAGRVAETDGAVVPGSDLYVLHANALTKECEVVRNLTNLPSNGVASTASEFALSPDRSKVAYLVDDGSVDAGAGVDKTALFVAAVDGSSAPTRVSGVPYGSGSNEGYQAGPRWIAGGSRLVLPQLATSIDAGDAGTALVVMPASGGSMKTVAVANPANQDRVFGLGKLASWSCSVANGPGSMVVGLGALGAFLGLVVRRRRRS